MNTAQPFHLFITVPGSFETGGVGRQVQYLTEKVAIAHPETTITLLDTRGLGHVAGSPLCILRSIGKLAAHRGERRRSVVHINLASYASTARKMVLMQAAKALGFPTLLHLHGAEYRSFYQKLPGVAKALVRRMFRQADTVVVLGAVWETFARETLGVSSEKLYVIPNTVPGPASLPVRTDSDVPVVLFLGRLGERKGTADLLNAMAALPADLPYRALLAGDGEVQRFAQQAASLGLGEKVQFPGWVSAPQAKDYLARADVFVLPSYNEGLPMAVLEALSYGLPVISTPVGSIPDAVTDGVEGILHAPGDVPALTAALHRLLASTTERQRIGSAARARYERDFAIERGYQAFWDRYQALQKA
jgi:glycosyltransferase involved in cell wall biosynthesis